VVISLRRFTARGDISINIGFPSSSTLGFNVAVAGVRGAFVVENAEEVLTRGWRLRVGLLAKRIFLDDRKVCLVMDE